jgi:hypothetical protein
MAFGGALQLPLTPADLGGTGQEDEHVATLTLKQGLHRFRNTLLQRR